MRDNGLSSAYSSGEIVDDYAAALRQGSALRSRNSAAATPSKPTRSATTCPALGLMEQAKSEDEDPGQRPQADAAPLRQLGDYQILREGPRLHGPRVIWPPTQ
jgi:hypothetical protein